MHASILLGRMPLLSPSLASGPLCPARRSLPFALAACAVALAACGGGAPPKAAAPHAAASAAPAFTSDVPRKPLPPPFHFTSKRAHLKEDARAASCTAGFATTTDPSADVARLSTACAPAMQMHAVGSPFTGTQAEGAPASRFKVHVEAGKCYRLFGVTAPGVKNVELFLMDSEGTPATEARSDASFVVADPRGAVCFTTADDAEVVVSVGAGEGAFAVVLASD